MYRELFSLSQTHPRQKTGATLLRDMLFTCGLGNFWYSQSVDNENAFLSVLKQRLTDIFIQEWWAEVNETSSHRLYKHIKTDFVYEDYLDICPNDTRIFLTKIRLSSHLFLIERGRWSRPKLEFRERKCSTCDTVEDEYHCLIECPRFAEERKNVTICLKCRPSMYEFTKFISNKNECTKAAILCKRVLNAYKEYV